MAEETKAGFYGTQDPNIDYSSAEYWTNLAQQWAIKLDGPVQGSDYSAQYWAQQAALSASESAVVLASVRAEVVRVVSDLQNQLGEAVAKVQTSEDQLKALAQRVAVLEDS